MECMEARALKSSFSSSELAMKSTNTKNFLDDIWCVTGLPPSENFSIDEFFDLPNDENFDGSSFLEEEEEKETSCSQDPVDDSNSNSIHFSPGLAIPVDDVRELELWSHLMDDSIPEPTLARPNPDAQKNKTGFNFLNRVDPGYSKPVNARASFIPSEVPVKPRTKRSRLTENRSWGLVFSPKTKSSSSSSHVSVLLYPAMARDLRLGIQFPNRKPGMKKSKKKPDENGSDQRRCSHCQVTKTPQWRAGPDGPKTLCNACGVRFKSGRLFPEYRPACSPTFSSEVHSNSHRKVLEMRKKNKPQESVSGSTSMPLAT